jgi:hypothetical protein
MVKILANCQPFRIEDQPRVTFGYRCGQLSGYFSAGLAGDVPTLAVDLVLTNPPSITTAIY